MPEKIINTIILDDNGAFREFLRGLLSEYDFINVIAETDSAEKTLEIMEKESPQLIIADIRLPGMGGIEFAGLLKDRGLEIRVILMTLYDNDHYRSAAAGLGFSYIPKKSLLEELPPLIEELGNADENTVG